MARLKIGSVFKSKDPTKSNYIKIDIFNTDSIVLKNGEYINVESKAYQLASLARAVGAGVITEDNAEKARARIEKMPDFVLGELILNTK
jgi:hypothetical protein